MAEANVTNELPPEILVKIFEHCGVNELVNIVDVCQLWRDVVIYQHMSVNDLVIRRPDDLRNLVCLLRKPVSLTKLHVVWDVPRYVDCSSVSLSALANATSLNHLQSFMFKVKEEHASKENTEYNKVLEALLTLVTKSSRDTLTHLRLISALYGSSSKVVEVLEACQHLSHLVLNGFWFDDVNRKRCVDIIPTLTHLELLDLRGISLVSDNYVSLIAAVKRGCPNISNNIMIDLSVRPSDDVSMLQFVSHANILDIRELDTEKLTTLVSCLNVSGNQPSVDELEIYSKHHLTDGILLSLVQHLRGVKEIDAQLCRHLTNQGVVNVITASPQLEEINISWIKNIDTNIIQLLGHVVTVKNVRIEAYGTKLSVEMRNHPGRELYTGRNKNIYLRWWL